MVDMLAVHTWRLPSSRGKPGRREHIYALLTFNNDRHCDTYRRWGISWSHHSSPSPLSRDVPSIVFNNIEIVIETLYLLSATQSHLEDKHQFNNHSCRRVTHRYLRWNNLACVILTVVLHVWTAYYRRRNLSLPSTMYELIISASSDPDCLSARSRSPALRSTIEVRYSSLTSSLMMMIVAWYIIS